MDLEIPLRAADQDALAPDDVIVRAQEKMDLVSSVAEPPALPAHGCGGAGGVGGRDDSSSGVTMAT